MTVKPAIGFFTREGDAVLVQTTSTIIASMKDNSNYTTPKPTLNAVSSANSAFVVAIAEAATGGPQQTVLKNAKRAELVALLRQLAIYVAGACGNDMAKLLSSGFPVQKPTRTPVGPLPTPRTPVVMQGAHKGEIFAAGAPINGAYSYGWRVALASAPEATVQTAVTSAARHTFGGLTPGQVYRVQTNAVGSAGETDWSNGAEMMVI